MEVKATAKYIRIAPRKLRIVMNLIRGKNVNEAFAILQFTPKVGSEVIEKVLRSAVANAEHNNDMNVDNLVVSSCYVDQGPTMRVENPTGTLIRITRSSYWKISRFVNSLKINCSCPVFPK